MSTADTYAPPALVMAAFIAVLLIWGDLTGVASRVVLAVAIVVLAGWCFLAGASAMDEQILQEKEAEGRDSLSG